MKEDRLLQCVDYLTWQIGKIKGWTEDEDVNKSFSDDEDYKIGLAYMLGLTEFLETLRDHFVDYINGEKYEPDFKDRKYEEYLSDKMTKGEDKE